MTTWDYLLTPRQNVNFYVLILFIGRMITSELVIKWKCYKNAERTAMFFKLNICQKIALLS